MEELRLLFLVLGTVAIAGILIHGLWSVRKNATQRKPSAYRTDPLGEDTDAQGRIIDAEIRIDEDDPLLSVDEDRPLTHGQFDDLGFGSIRTVQKEAEPLEDADDLGAPLPEPQEVEPEEPPPEDSPKIYSSVVTQPKPEYAAEQQAIQRRALADGAEFSEIPEPPPSLLKKTEQSDSPAAKKNEQVELAEQSKKVLKSKKAGGRKRREPKIDEDQMRIDFEDAGSEQTSEPAPESAPSQEVLVLNVKAADDNPIPGSALLPMLLTLGFKFGDQDIFHRHVNSNGKGPVLFSLANMFKPGVFDIDNLENFTTQGVSLFMILPIEGDPHQVFNMMHNAARKIADEFSAQVLDGRRSALNKQSLQQYVEKIREFERLRMIAR